MISRNAGLFVLGALVSAIFLWLALRGVSFDEIARAFGQARPLWAIPLLAMLLGFCLTKAARWALLLGLPIRASLSPLTRAVLVGYGATSLLPLQLGELARVWAAARAVRLPMAPVLVSVAMERVLDLLAIVLVLGAALLLGGSLPAGLLQTGYGLAALGVALLVALALYVARTEQVLRAVARATVLLPGPWQERLQRQLRQGASGAQVLQRPRAWAALAVLSVGQWVCMAGCIAASFAALDLAVPVAAAASVLGLTILGMSLPSGPGYVGSIQLAFTLGLAPFAVDSSHAIAASLYYHVLVCGSLIVAGVIALHRLGGTLSELRAPASDTDSSTDLTTPRGEK